MISKNHKSKSKKPSECFCNPEDLYRSMIDQSMIGVCVFDKMKIVFANKKLANIFGYNIDEFSKINLKNFLIPTSYKTAKSNIISRQNNDIIPEIGEYIGIRKGGKRIYLQTHSKRVVFNGKPYSQVFIIDITEKKLTEIKLNERAKEMEVLFHIQAHTLIARPLPLVLSDVSRDIVKSLQYPEFAYSEIIFDGKTYSSGEKPNKFIFKIEQSLVVRNSKRGVIRLGYTKKHPNMIGTPFWQEEKRLVKTVARILTKHVYSRETVERYQKVVKKSIAGIYITEGNIIRYANPRFCKMMKCKEKNLIGSSIYKFLIDCNFETQGLVPFETKAKRKNGEIIDVQVINQKMDYHGASGLIGRIHDITKIKEASQKMSNFNKKLKKLVKEKTQNLQEANKSLLSLNKLKDEFIAITSHELRSPITSIRGYLSFLVDDDKLLNKLPDFAQEYLRRSYNNTKSLDHLVNNILDVSRLETNKLEINKKQFDFISLVSSIVKDFKFQADKKSIKLQFKNIINQKTFLTNFDILRVSQILRNIIDNAIKFSHQHKTVLIRISKANKNVICEIIDHGIGIPKTKIDNVFDKFIQVKNINTRYKGGAGLGLYIAKHLIELHNGSISVQSQNGKGTTFTIKLPLK